MRAVPLAAVDRRLPVEFVEIDRTGILARLQVGLGPRTLAERTGGGDGEEQVGG